MSVVRQDFLENLRSTELETNLQDSAEIFISTGLSKQGVEITLQWFLA